jgi:hypothetical protein
LLVPLLLVLFLSSVPSCSAHELKLESSKDVYSLGDNILVTVEVRNTEDHPIEVAVSAVLKDLEMRSPPMPIYYQVELQAGENETITIYEIPVDEGLYSGEYVVEASLIEGGVEVYEDEINFTVQGLPEDMDVEVLVCKDSTYAEKSLVFIKGEDIYINYVSDPPGPVMTATLTFPDNSQNPLTFPFHMKAEDVGNYTLHFTASKEGYRTFDGMTYFGVLEKEPNPEEIGEPLPSFPTLYLGVLIAVIAVVAAVLYTRRREPHRGS